MKVRITTLLLMAVLTLVPALVSAQDATPVASSLPEAARGPAIPEKGYLVEEIRDGLYWITEGSYQAMFLTTGEGVIVVDAPPTIGERLLAAITEVTSEPITHVIYSHHHTDHIGAAGLYPDDATYISHEAAAEQLTRSADPNRPIPTETFADSYTLTVGNQTLELTYNGTNHTAGNIFVYAPQQRVLMVVDIIFPGWIPFKNLALAENIPAFIAAHDEILAYDFDTLVAGHLTRLGTREDVEVQKEYVLDLRTNAGQALQTVDFMAIAQETGLENQWLLYSTYLDTVAQTCADATIPAWKDRLGGVEVWTFDHCWVMMESLNID